MKKYNLFFIMSLLLHIVNINASEVYADTFFLNPTAEINIDKKAMDTLEDRILNASSACLYLSKWSLNKFFYPGQALMACKLWDVNPTTCRMKMEEFKSVQFNRCCMFTGAACALGTGALACSACGCTGIAAAATTGSKVCAAGACIVPQIPYEFSFESPTGNPKEN